MSNPADGVTEGIQEEGELQIPEKELKGKKRSWQKLRTYSSWDLETAAHTAHRSKNDDWWTILQLAFQTLGVVYGDIGTSPLYVYDSTFPDGIKHKEDILGAFSLIFYTLALIPLFKYVFIVLYANDNGEGGTFALYSLICRYAKVSLLPSEQAEDREVSNYKLDLPNDRRFQRASKLKSLLENSQFAKVSLLMIALLGTSMVIGDGILTPSMSVLSAVDGLRKATHRMTEGRIVWISVAILICLFLVQKMGTDKVGYSFAPIITVWFLMIGGIGLFNFFKYDPLVIMALNPKYIVDYFKRNEKNAWISLGGVVLAITGTEAMFADVGHFSVRSIQISMCSMTFPALIFAYAGQASYLRKHPNAIGSTFYDSIPDPLYWPMFAVAVAASIIASQAMISGTFSIVQQSLALGCFPLVKVVHTSAKYEGQVYIPEMNYLLMVACVAVTAGLRRPSEIGNAYGIAVVFVMTLTSTMLVLIMILIWKISIILVILYVVIIGGIEFLYLSSVLYKFDEKGYLPVAFAVVLISIMYIWNYTYRKKYNYELQNKVSSDIVKEIASSSNCRRLPGIAFFYSELVHGIPPIFRHYVDNVPALHSVIIFLSIKSLPISKVPQNERFLFRRMESGEFAVFRCVVRYGYMDVQNEHMPFEEVLVDQLKAFILNDLCNSVIRQRNGDFPLEHVVAVEGGDVDEEEDEKNRKEVELIEREFKEGVIHLLGETEVIAGKHSSLGKRVLIDYAYTSLKRNLRQRDEVFEVPRKRLLKVGMTYEL